MNHLVIAAAITLVAGCTSEAPRQGEVLVPAVRAAIAQGEFSRGEQLVEAHRRTHGVTPEMLAALSWLGRGALAAREFPAAEKYATETYEHSRAQLSGRVLDDEPHLPIALGAAIEVLAHVMAEQGARTEAVAFLHREREAHRGTSVEKRIQKNIHLLSLEGQPAPDIEVSDHVGPAPTPLDRLRGKPVLLFFWAHWCSDCKAQAPMLARIAARYADQGLAVVAPTQRFGYVAGGESATPGEESRYIDEMRRMSYAMPAATPVPLSADNHLRYGVSSTPTIVLIDRQGIVQLYHPGRIAEEELDAAVRRVLN